MVSSITSSIVAPLVSTSWSSSPLWLVSYLSKASRCASRGGAAAGIAVREGLRSANFSSVCDDEGLVQLCDAANGSTFL
eukprot:scaffold73972_cov67-Phaeocystis_antarctica.AAC.1